MLWKLRLSWHRTDLAAWAFVSYFVLVVGALVFAASEVFNKRDAERALVRDFHALSLDCRARNVYYEARGESAAGQYAVAEVTMNRKAAPFYPKTVCEVVYQREAFPWTDAKGLETSAGAAWKRAQKVADEVYYQRRVPTMSGVLHFHAVYVQPDWSKERRRVARIGRHVFYR